MSAFQTGDRVICVNADMSGPILPAKGSDGGLDGFEFPDGPLQKGVIYRIDRIQPSYNGSPGLHLTGMRVLYLGHEQTWHHSRFRKVDWKKDYEVKAETKKEPARKTTARPGPKRVAVTCKMGSA